MNPEGMNPEAGTRCGFVAVAGPPNAGKSTLINALAGEKISIVSRKAQTTRSAVRGIVTRGDSQVVLVDTPGLFSPRRRLDRAMTGAAAAAIADADAVLLVLDARRDPEKIPGFEDVRRALAARPPDTPLFVALNKSDLVKKPALLEQAALIDGLVDFEALYMISALTADGLEQLADGLHARMPPGPLLYPPDQISDLPLRMMAAELTREQIYDRLHEELPYAITVVTDSWEEGGDGIVRIEQSIVVARESQKGIVLGKGGAMVKALGEAARREIEAMIEQQVFLRLHVRAENWEERESYFSMWGLDFRGS